VGSGKSTALAAFRRLGAATLSTDAVVHDLYASEAVRDAVVQRFGAKVAPNGRVDRAALAAAAFATPEDRSWLEGVLWPRVGERIAAWRAAELEREPPPAALVVEVPLLFEAGMGEAFDATIAVVANEEVRAQRAAGRGHAAVDERVARQLPQEEKARRADHAVVNDGSVEELERNLSAVLGMLRS
jgi:dephospho-CoA kinase